MSTGGSPVPTDFESAEASPNQRQRDFADVPENLWSKVRNAQPFEAEFNEENLFKQQYFESAKIYYESATAVNAQGRAILQLFMRWADVAAQWTRYVLRGDADNPLDAVLSWDPEGAGEAYVRPLRPVTFQSQGNPAAAYTQTPTSTGRFNLIPDEANATNGDRETAPQNEKAWMIFGWVERLAGNEVPYDVVQANINDNRGTRREEFLVYQMEGKQTLKVSERSRGPLLVEPGFGLDIDLDIKTTNIQTGLWPIGIEVIRADSSEFGSVFNSVTN